MRTLSSTGITFTGTSKTGTLGSGPPSRLYGVFFTYDASAPGTTTITLSNMGRQIFSSPATNISSYYPIKEFAWNGALTPSTQFTSTATNNVLVECFVNGDISWTIANAASTTGSGYDILVFVYDGD